MTIEPPDTAGHPQAENTPPGLSRGGLDIYYYRDPEYNFGDDLNEIIWPNVLAPDVLAVEDAVIVGIGSILTESYAGTQLPPGKRVIVLGSGLSYDQPPRDMTDWHVLAVRGPWTAQMIRMPERAVTDGAILLADVKAVSEREANPQKTLFMPHHRSILATDWERVARDAGMTFVSPQQPVDAILAQFAEAKLVVTEAMHGAIVADTLRIPWVPVTVSPAVEEFKWRDWMQSIDLNYEPVAVPAGHVSDVRRYDKMQRILSRGGLGGHEVLDEVNSRLQLQFYCDRRFDPELKTALRRCGPTAIGRRLEKLLVSETRRLRARATESLIGAKNGRSILSNDNIFTQRLDEMRSAVHKASRIALGS